MLITFFKFLVKKERHQSVFDWLLETSKYNSRELLNQRKQMPCHISHPNIKIFITETNNKKRVHGYRNILVLYRGWQKSSDICSNFLMICPIRISREHNPLHNTNLKYFSTNTCRKWTDHLLWSTILICSIFSMFNLWKI